MTSKPVAVIIGDIHFNLQNLELATKSVLIAKNTARDLRVPLILNGDTLDQKAIVRAEVMNRLLEIFTLPVAHQSYPERVYINVGNHDMINVHGKEHSLNFLRPYATIIYTPTYLKELQSWIIPYHHNTQEFLNVLSTVPNGSRLIIHQGLSGALPGEYLSDKTALPPEAFASFRTIASHYHARQDIKCGQPRKGAVGLFSYVGSPYTQSFGEAFDEPKCISVLSDDGLLTYIPTRLRKHVILEFKATDIPKFLPYSNLDRIWVKVHGTLCELSTISKTKLGETLFGHSNYRLDKIPIDSKKITINNRVKDNELLDQLIAASGESEAQQLYLKNLWRDIYEAS